MKVKFDMIGLFVSDISKMVDFYKNIIGIDVTWNNKYPYAEFKHEGIRFSMYERKKLPEIFEQTLTYPKGLNGTFELAINVGEPKNVDITFKKMIEGGANSIYEPRNESWKMRSAMISDPDGNLIEIASDFWE